MNTLNYECKNHTISSKDLKTNLRSNYFVKISNSTYKLWIFQFSIKTSQSIKIQPLFMTVTISGLFFFLHGLIQYTVPMSTSVSFPFSSG